jgi:pyruvate formate-lyase activating enzyme-like uncharacterized protein
MNNENIYIIIDNNNNFFNLNELVFKTETTDHLNRRLYKSLERNFSCFIYDIQATPRQTNEKKH